MLARRQLGGSASTALGIPEDRDLLACPAQLAECLLLVGQCRGDYRQDLRLGGAAEEAPNLLVDRDLLIHPSHLPPNLCPFDQLSGDSARVRSVHSAGL